MIKLIAALFFTTIVYLLALLIATVFSASVATTFAFLIAVLVIEDRIPPQT